MGDTGLPTAALRPLPRALTRSVLPQKVSTGGYRVVRRRSSHLGCGAQAHADNGQPGRATHAESGQAGRANHKTVSGKTVSGEAEHGSRQHGPCEPGGGDGCEVCGWGGVCVCVCVCGCVGVCGWECVCVCLRVSHIGVVRGPPY